MRPRPRRIGRSPSTSRCARAGTPRTKPERVRRRRKLHLCMALTSAAKGARVRPGRLMPGRTGATSVRDQPRLLGLRCGSRWASGRGDRRVVAGRAIIDAERPSPSDPTGRPYGPRKCGGPEHSAGYRNPAKRIMSSLDWRTMDPICPEPNGGVARLQRKRVIRRRKASLNLKRCGLRPESGGAPRRDHSRLKLRIQDSRAPLFGSIPPSGSDSLG